MTVEDNPAERGDQYIWIALDSETKAVLSYYVGKRDDLSAYEFMGDLSKRIVGRCQITTDGLKGYILEYTSEPLAPVGVVGCAFSKDCKLPGNT